MEIGNGTLVEVSVWAVLFGALLLLVCMYVFYRLIVRHEAKKQEALRTQLNEERRKAMEIVERNTLKEVSQRLLPPLTLVISPLQQMAEESLPEDLHGRLQMVLRNAQLLLRQVNLLPMNQAGASMSSVNPVMEAAMQPVGSHAVSASDTSGLSTLPSPAPTSRRGVDDSNAAEVASQHEESRQDEAQEEHHRFTMLMVDDSPDMCRFVHDYFRGDYQVLTAGNGEQALQQLEENDGIDLVVSDVTMPKMDGLELCRRIKTDLRWSHIPVILLTGRTGQEMEMEGLKLGADDYITKPFNVEMLRLRVKKLVEKKESRQRQFREKIDVSPSEITITSVDEQFIQHAIKICEDHISDTEFSVEALGHELSLSRTYLYKKLINITGKGPAEFIRTIRMKRGKQYLEKTSMQITEIAAALGYSNPKRFTENFKAEYGMSPSEYTRKYRAEHSVKMPI